MFSDCSSLIELPDISKWDTKNVTNITGMFNNCSSLKELPDISNWNMNNVTSLILIFSQCTLLKELPDISNEILVILLVWLPCFLNVPL